MAKSRIPNQHSGPGVWYIPIDAYIEGVGFRVSLVFEDEAGHYPTGTWPYHGQPGEKMPWFARTDSYEQAKTIAKEINEDNGFSEREVAIIVARSMNCYRLPR